MAKKKKEEILDKEEKKTRKKRKKPLENEETLSSSLEKILDGKELKYTIADSRFTMIYIY